MALVSRSPRLSFAALAACALAACGALAAPLFEGRQDLAVGTLPWAEVDPATGTHLDRSPFSLGLGDVDGDGDIDVVAAAAASTFLSTFLNGDGEAAMAPVPVDATGVGNLPRALRLANLDGNGRADVVAIFPGDNQVGICLGQAAPPYYPAGSFTKLATQQVPSSLVLADLNGDGILDLAVSNRGAGSISVYQGAAGGSFTARGAFPSGAAGAEPVDVAALDVDGDGDRDLVAANAAAGDVTLLLHGASFTFGNAASIASIGSPSRVQAGLVDADGIHDLAIASRTAGGVTVLRGNGTGGFTGAGTFSAGIALAWVEIGDMDADADSDLVVAEASAGRIGLLRQTAASPLAFGGMLAWACGASPQQVALADLDADGLLDIGVANAGSHDVSVFLNRGDGRPATDVSVATTGSGGSGGDGPEAVGVGEIDGGSGIDVISTNRITPDGSVLRNDGFGGLIPPTQSGGWPTQLAAAAGATTMALADLDGDGKVEYVTGGTDGAAGRVKIVKSGGGEVNPALPPSVAVSDVELARVDADGLLDLLVLDRGQAGSGTAGHLYVLLGTGTPSLFGAAVTVTVPGLAGTSEPIAMAVSDLNGDTAADVAVLFRNHPSPTGDVAILVNSSGSLVPGPAPTLYTIGLTPTATMPEPKPSDIAAGDGDGDGDLDLAVADGTQNIVTVLPNAGNATFSGTKSTLKARHAFAQHVAWIDVDGNARIDLAASNGTDDDVSVFLATGGFAFAAPVGVGVEGGPAGLAVWDREGDGDVDLLVADSLADRVSILTNLRRGAQAVVTGPGPGSANAATVRSWRADGTAIANIDFVPYQNPAPWGANVAAHDLDGAGVHEILTGPGPGPQAPPLVRTWRANGTALGADVTAYGGGGYGVNVHGAELDGDATGEVLTGPGPGAVYGPHVKGWQFTGTALTALAKINFFAYGTLQYGAGVGSGRLDTDPYHEIVTGAGPGAVFGPHVRGFNFDNASVTAIAKVSYFAYSTLKYGVNARAADLDRDGWAEMVTGPGPGSVFGAVLRGFNFDQQTTTSIARINANVFPAWRFGLNVEAGDLEGDGYAEIVTGAGDDPAGSAEVQAFDYDDDRLQTIAALGFDAEPGLLYGVNVTFADLGRYGR